MKKYQKILVTAACAAVLSGSVLAAENTTALKDINGYWGKEAVQYFYDNHYVSGIGGAFKPNDDITREGAASILNNLIGGDSPAVVDFKDVTGRWSEKAIASVVDKQIMKGYEDGSFKPEKAITRQEFAVIAYNYMNYKGIGAEESAVDYTDEKDVAPWAKKAVDTLHATGYMTGADNMFRPMKNITRGEAVNVLYRILTGNTKTQTEERTVETRVFADITKVYGSVKKFADDGAMYWQGGKLYVAVKNAGNRAKLEDAFRNDAGIAADTVIVRKGSYSYNDYKKMQADALAIYKEKEEGEARVEVDYLNEKVNLYANPVSASTAKKLKKALGNALVIK